MTEALSECGSYLPRQPRCWLILKSRSPARNVLSMSLCESSLDRSPARNVLSMSLESTENSKLLRFFDRSLPADPSPGERHRWPRKPGSCVWAMLLSPSARPPTHRVRTALPDCSSRVCRAHLRLGRGRSARCWCRSTGCSTLAQAICYGLVDDSCPSLQSIWTKGCSCLTS